MTKNLYRNKSPGLDGIPAQLYQTFQFTLEWLFQIIEKLCTKKKLTETMTTSTVNLLFKKGDRRQIENYRPLSLACTYYKILAKVIT